MKKLWFLMSMLILATWGRAYNTEDRNFTPPERYSELGNETTAQYALSSVSPTVVSASFDLASYGGFYLSTTGTSTLVEVDFSGDNSYWELTQSLIGPVNQFVKKAGRYARIRNSRVNAATTTMTAYYFRATTPSNPVVTGTVTANQGTAGTQNWFGVLTNTSSVNVAQWNGTNLTATNPMPVSGTTTSYGAWTNGANLSNTTAITLVGSLAFNGTNNTFNVQPYQGSSTVSSTNGNYTNILQGNAVLSPSNALAISGSVNIEGVKSTYFACVTGLATAASATDVFTITGAGSTTIRITRIIISASQATGALNRINLIKRSTADTGGTSFLSQIGAADSNNPSAGAVVKFYTVNPGALGTQVAIIDSDLLNIQATTGSNSDIYYKDFELRGEQAIVLRGTAQQLCVNLDGATIGTSAFNICVTWTEEN